jgi:stage II sporulation protein D
VPRLPVLVLLVVSALAIACGGARRPVGGPVPAPRPTPGTGPGTGPGPVPGTRPDPNADAGPVRVLTADGRVEIVALERYVRGTVEAESWAPRGEPAALSERLYELQALIARTYVAANLDRHRGAGANVCTTTHCQIYRAPSPLHVHADRLDAALARSAGRVLRFDGEPILALFHSSCGGATSAADAVWGGRARPYLRSVPDEVCVRAAIPWTMRLERDALVRALDADSRTRVDGRLDAIDVVSRDAGDRAVLVALTGRRSPVVRGEELRAVLTRSFGARSVRSTRVRIARDGDAFLLEGTGFGHGAGLCQAGALARLRAGVSIEEVIAHYYPGVTIDGEANITDLGLPAPAGRRSALAPRFGFAELTPR